MSFLNLFTEPTFTAETSDKLNLIKGLNYYSQNYDFDKSKAWALKWAKKNLSADIVFRLRQAAEWHFGNTGFVFRLIERGFQLNQEQVTKMKAELIAISNGYCRTEGN